jgi:signal transduction histidine kinase
MFYRNSINQKKSRILLQQQKNELEQSLRQLKTTQTQLVQAEKMASLGELTAGIAHEIQNPLNFVNNFAELNAELIDELATEANKGNLEEVKLLAKDIKENETKINHHGKRADAIVKNMLQHSRKTSGQKELTDINALCDEYLRLSYHGLRAKDKSFNAEFETKFDTTLAPINVVPQDIGRVILNLINNAFYAVNERQKKEQNSGYKPLVTLKTSEQGDQVVIEVADNGTGMTEQIKEKIFQPFFTTKPTGEGTGLGLSLSYDIVTKGHGGTMEVLTREGEGSKIIVRLPL